MRSEATLVECGSVTAALSLLLHARLPVHVRSALRSACRHWHTAEVPDLADGCR